MEDNNIQATQDKPLQTAQEIATAKTVEKSEAPKTPVPKTQQPKNTIQLVLGLIIVLVVIVLTGLGVYWLNSGDVVVSANPDSYPLDGLGNIGGEGGESETEIQTYTNTLFPGLEIPYDPSIWTVTESTHNDVKRSEFPITTITFKTGGNSLNFELITFAEIDGGGSFNCERMPDVKFIDPQSITLSDGTQYKRYLSRYQINATATKATGQYNALYSISGYQPTDRLILENQDHVNKNDSNPNICFANTELIIDAKPTESTADLVATVQITYTGAKDQISAADELVTEFTTLK